MAANTDRPQGPLSALALAFANICRDTMYVARMSSFGSGIIFGHLELFWGTDDRWNESSLSTCSRNLSLQVGIENMLKVPGRYELCTVYGGRLGHSASR